MRRDVPAHIGAAIGEQDMGDRGEEQRIGPRTDRDPVVGLLRRP